VRQAAAERLLRRAQAAHPGDFWLEEELGLALANKPGRGEETAVRFLTAAAALRPDSPGAHYNLGNALAAQRLYEEAVTAYRRAVDLEPGYAPAHSNLGIALGKQGKVAEAIAAFRQALALDPKLAHAHSNLGHALYEQGKYEEAIAACRRAIRLDSKLPQAHINLGNVRLAQGKTDAAIQSFRRVVRLAPKEAQGHRTLGDALYAQRKLDEAIACYRRAIRLDPKDAHAHSNLGNALSRQGKHEEAVAVHRQAIALEPKDSRMHFNLGVALKQQGKADEAIAVFRRTVRLDPKFARAYGNLGAVLCDRKRDYQGAVAAFRQAIALEPKNAALHFNLGIALFHQGRFREARTSTRRCLDLLPQRHPVRTAAEQRMARYEHLLALERKLPEVLAGKREPASNAERLTCAALAALANKYAGAARLYAAAFVAEPKLADNLRAGHRYRAARCAAQAGCGQGQDDPRPDEKERTRWLGQALGWLRADLALRAKQAGGNPAQRKLAQAVLRYWQKDPALACVRDKEALARLPEAQRAGWQKLWGDVAGLLARAG
jgi:tetratricopeptide (TPR) repeat protein